MIFIIPRAEPRNYEYFFVGIHDNTLERVLQLLHTIFIIIIIWIRNEWEEVATHQRSLAHHSQFSRLGICIQCYILTLNFLRHCGHLFSKPLIFKAKVAVLIFSKPFVAVFYQFYKPLWLLVCCDYLLIASTPLLSC